MKARLYEGLNEDDKNTAEYEFAKAVKFRERLTEVLEKEIEVFVINMTKEDHFDSASWSLIQADRVAQIKAYRKIIGLLK